MMMKNLSALIGWVLILIGLGIYLYGIYYAIFTPIQVFDMAGNLVQLKIPETLDTLTTTIGAILLTNLGAVLGISLSQPKSALANRTSFSKASLEISEPMNKREILQYIAVLIYLTVLFACFITWAFYSFQTSGEAKPIVSLVEQYGKTLIGVITAYIAFALGVTKT